MAQCSEVVMVWWWVSPLLKDFLKLKNLDSSYVALTFFVRFLVQIPWQLINADYVGGCSMDVLWNVLHLVSLRITNVLLWDVLHTPRTNLSINRDHGFHTQLIAVHASHSLSHYYLSGFGDYNVISFIPCFVANFVAEYWLTSFGQAHFCECENLPHRVIRVLESSSMLLQQESVVNKRSEWKCLCINSGVDTGNTRLRHKGCVVF